MNIKILSATLLTTFLSFESCSDSTPEAKREKKYVREREHVIHSNGTKKIQVALLLDTSSSMDGLIEQAKSRLWNIVNTLTTLKYEGETPEIEIALYEYGNDGIREDSDFIRQISALSTDLDVISENLFSLNTYGGEEYCGAVISDATNQLKWGDDEGDMRLIYIAGNEEFNQGETSFKEAIQNARNKDIYINTIFCGDVTEGINTFWKAGADIGSGKFFSINSDEKVDFIETPYDTRISKCNEKMNDTYIGYGSLGEMKKSNQVTQDRNACSISSANYTERTVCKSSKAYKNGEWDLVDKVELEKDAIKTINKNDLPKELKNKSTKEIEKYVRKKANERKTIQKQIADLAQKRQDYIDKEMKKVKGKDDLGGAIKRSIIEFAKTKGYTLEK